MKNSIITANPLFEQDPEYIKVCNVIQRLIETGIVARGEGHCISMSSMLHALLLQNGITSHMVECQVVISHNESKRLVFIGFDSTASENTVDSHVVLITATKIPMIIDVSIGHKLPKHYQVVIDVAGKDKNTLANVQHNDVTLTYEEKQKNNIPLIHQRSIVDRIATDTKIFEQMRVLKITNYVGLGISCFSILNTLLNFAMLYLVK
jgi:hypothetical protein